MGLMDGKIALIFGVANKNSIAWGITKKFHEEGATILLCYAGEIMEKRVFPLAQEIGCEFVEPADVTKDADVANLVEQVKNKFGGLDILVNNAAVFVLKGLEATVDDWQRSLSVNIVGTAQMSKYASEHMKQSGGGAIVNLGSISSFVAQPSFIAYSSTKAAIVQMTRNMALDLAPFNIRVNCVCPGTILTRATEAHMALVGMSKEDFIAAEAPKHLLNRVGDPREVAYPILFLASDEASFITGTHLMVDGGYTTQ